MGLFKNRHNKSSNAEPHTAQNGAEYKPETINLWDDRRPQRVHHAASVDEILSGLSLTADIAGNRDNSAENRVNGAENHTDSSYAASKENTALSADDGINNVNETNEKSKTEKTDNGQKDREKAEINPEKSNKTEQTDKESEVLDKALPHSTKSKEEKELKSHAEADNKGANTVKVPKEEMPKYADPGFHAEVEIAARPGTPAERERAEFSEEFFREPEGTERPNKPEDNTALFAAMNAAGKAAADSAESDLEPAERGDESEQRQSAVTDTKSSAEKSAAERADELIRRLKEQAFSTVQGLADEKNPENSATDVVESLKAPKLQEEKAKAETSTDSEMQTAYSEGSASKEKSETAGEKAENNNEKSETAGEKTENENQNKKAEHLNSGKHTAHRAAALTPQELLGISMDGASEHPSPNVLKAAEVLGNGGAAFVNTRPTVGLHSNEDEELLDELFMTRAEKRAQRKAQKKAERQFKRSQKQDGGTELSHESRLDNTSTAKMKTPEEDISEKASEKVSDIPHLSVEIPQNTAENATVHTAENTANSAAKSNANAVEISSDKAQKPNTKADGIRPIEMPNNAENSAEHSEEKPHDEKKEIKLSPTAQVLYDRMMAQLVLERKLHSDFHTSSTAEALEADKAEKRPENEDPAQSKSETAPDKGLTEKTDKTDKAETKPETSLRDLSGIEAAPTDSGGTESRTESRTAEHESRESLADSIFNSLSESLAEENPLSRQKSRSADSLLSKCRSYVNPKYDLDAPSGSIDDIIHSAEKGARERLSNFYDIQSGEPIKRTAEPHDFSAFTARTAKQNDDLSNTISIPVKLSDETTENAVIKSASGDIKNFQYSFADNSQGADSDNLGDTKIVDIQSSTAARRQVTDPEKMKQIKMHLQKLTEEEPEDELAKTQKVKFTGDSEPEVPDAEVSAFDNDPPLVDDYKDISDAQTVRTDLSSQRVSVIARLIPTAVITAVLFVLDLIFRDALVKSSVFTYTLLNIILLAAALCVNMKTLRGFIGVLSGTPDMDSPSALAAVVTLLYTLTGAISGNLTELPPLAPIGAMTLTFNLFAKLSILKRVRRGFEVIANDREKKAVTFVADRTSAKLLAGDSVIGDALIAAGKSTTNITNYLKNAYSEDAYEKRLTPLLAATLITAAVFSLIGFFAGGGLSAALVAFCTVTLVACPPSSLFACNLPLSLASKTLADYDAMIAGPEPMDSIANANAVAFDVCDLFPAGTIKLYNMQVLNRGAVDRYIASAAAVLTAAKSPLSPIFEEILQSDNEEIPTADSVKYENNMGVSGWIGDHRVFVGNRTLMEGHSIRTPSLELDKKILRQGYFPVYLAFDNMLCALFIVGYEADEEITYELRRLCSTGVTMLVNSNDPNVSGEMLCDYFGLYKDSVKVMGASGVSAYKNAVRHVDSYPAFASYGGKISGFLASVTAAIRAKSLIGILMILQIVFICLGVAVTGYWIFAGVLLKLPVALLAGAQLLCAAVTAVVGYLKQP